MKCKIEINMDNDSFEKIRPAYELAAILIKAGRRLQDGFIPNEKVNLMDSNGNVVGYYRIK